jgi:hypothetical protein
MKKWFAPQVAAETLYKQAAAKGVHVPLGETATVVDDILKNEINRMPTEAQEEILKVVAPLQNFITPTMGKTKTKFLTSQPVVDSLADIRRLSTAAKKAFGGKTPNTDLGNMIIRIRAAMFDDLKKSAFRGASSFRALSRQRTKLWPSRYRADSRLKT